MVVRSTSVVAGPGGLPRRDCAIFCPPRWRGLSRSDWGGRQSARARCRLRATPHWTLSGVRVYLGNVAPLAQRLEQRPFKSWVVGSNPTGGTVKSLEIGVSGDFLLAIDFRPW